MDSDIKRFLQNNKEWAANKALDDPTFFKKLAAGQKPTALLLGCSDSRMSPTVVMGIELGEIFVHRNIANIAAHTDLNFLSVLQYAVEVLEVHHVIVYGHYGCGGVGAAMAGNPMGLIDNWLVLIKDVAELHKDELDAIDDDEARVDRLVELNVLAQVRNLHQSSVYQEAKAAGHEVQIHAWVHDFHTGRIKVLPS